MKKHLIFILALVAIVLSCNKENLQNDPAAVPEIDALQTQKLLSPLINYDVTTCFPNYQVPLNAKKGKPKTKTIKIRGAGTTKLLFPPNNNCGENEIEVVLEGEGHATHLGLFSFNSTYCSLDGQNPVDLILGIQTAANGNELHSVLVGAGEDPELGTYQDWVFIGGTGRFEDASGNVRLYTMVDFVNLTWSNHGVGTLTY